jgi:hypothetical protein
LVSAIIKFCVFYESSCLSPSSSRFPSQSFRKFSENLKRLDLIPGNRCGVLFGGDSTAALGEFRLHRLLSITPSPRLTPSQGGTRCPSARRSWWRRRLNALAKLWRLCRLILRLRRTVWHRLAAASRSTFEIGNRYCYFNSSFRKSVRRKFQVFARLRRDERPVAAVPGATAIGSHNSEMISRVGS